MNKVIVITDATSGFGLAMAEKFAKSGCRLALVAKGKEKLAKLAADVEKHGAKSLAISSAIRLTILFLITCCIQLDAFGKQPPAVIDLAGYQNRGGGAGVPNPPLVNGQFDEGSKGWTLPKGAEVKSNEGLNQTGALFMEVTNPGFQPMAVQNVPLRPNTTYRFSVQIRTEDCKVLKGTPGFWTGASICVEFARDGKYVGGSYHVAGVNGTSNWTRREGTVVVPAGVDSGTITLLIRKGNTGKAWFDDVSIVPEAASPFAYLIRPAANRFLPTDGSFVIRWDNLGFTANDPAGNLTAWVRLMSGDEVVKDGLFPLKGMLTTGTLGVLPQGDFTLEAILVDPAKKHILHQQSFSVACKDSSAGGHNAVRIDNHGRTFVGKDEFMPVGLFLQEVTPDILDRIAASPFNTVLSYRSLDMPIPKGAAEATLAKPIIPGPGQERVKGVRLAMDACHERNLKYIFCLAPWPGMNAKEELESKEQATEKNKGRLAQSETLINNLKDHPALLAWYTADEPAPNLAPGLSRFREWLRQRDPFHPSYVVYMHFNELPLYADSADIMGIDPYPIENKHDSMTMVESATRGSQSAIGTKLAQGMPLWVVPQAHNLGTYGADRKNGNVSREALLQTGHISPSEEDMRAMSLRMAIGGARGFIFYSYFDLVFPNVMPEFDRRWAELGRVAALLRELQPFLYSEEKAPEITLKTTTGTVNAAAYKTADGKVKVLITGNGPGASEADITVADCDNLRSRYGKTESLGGGKYRFKGADICSDVLE